VWIDVPIRGMRTYQSHGALGVFQRLHRHFAIVRAAIGLPVVRMTRHAILEQYAGNARRHQPIADFRSLQIDRQDFKTATGNDEHRGTGTLAGRCVDGHRRLGDVRDRGDRLPGKQMAFADRHLFRTWQRLRIRRGSWPQPDLLTAVGRLPNRRVGSRRCADDQEKQRQEKSHTGAKNANSKGASTENGVRVPLAGRVYEKAL
jgi:hypothetical protein